MIYLDENNRLVLTAARDIDEFCQLGKIRRTEFNFPVFIPKRVKDCASMFEGCTSFNQPIKIPDSVEDCSFMFKGCESLKQEINVPLQHANCADMF